MQAKIGKLHETCCLIRCLGARIYRRAGQLRRGRLRSGSVRIEPADPSVTKTERAVPTIENLTGYGDAAKWALALQQDLTLFRTGAIGWEDMSTKLLLSGPPGTGKTLFARALCNSLEVPLISTSVSTWLEPGYLGDVIKRMSAAFAEAEADSPSILFIDEFDGIGRRGAAGEGTHYCDQIVNRLLVLLDGTSRTNGVIVVAATNAPHAIDEALLRSGRMETHVVLALPDTDELVGILAHHLGDDLVSVIASAPQANFT